MITVITCWYNEAFLAPFFLWHYRYCDKIIVLVDDFTTDGCYSIAQAAPNTIVKTINYGKQMDERLKVKYINEEYKQINSGFVFNVDADEFIFFDAQEFESAKWDIARVKFANVYRHKTDKNLDNTVPVVEQRRHGVFAWPYRKPIVARAGLDVKWGIGNHVITVNGKREKYYYSGIEDNIPHRDDDFIGAHWVYADPCFSVQRRLDRLRRIGASVHRGDENEKNIIDKLKQHENDAEAL